MQKRKRYNKNLIIGEKLGISFGHETTYPTLLEDIQEDGRLVISYPIYRGSPVNMKKEQNIIVFFYRENGLYSFKAQVYDFTYSGRLRLIVLEAQSAPVRQQRRDSFRLPCVLDVQMRLFAGGGYLMGNDEDDEENPWEDTYTNNISETGISISTARQYQRNDQVQIRLRLPGSGRGTRRLSMLGAIRQCELVDYDIIRYRVGIEFMAISDEMRRAISRFILTRQQQILKQEAASHEERR